jgi:predicted phosphate transport protein (TIGR00153 family)
LLAATVLDLGKSVLLGVITLNIFRRKSDVDFLNLLIQAAENSLKAAHFFRSAMMGSKPPAQFLSTVKDLENKGDQITHDIFMGLYKVSRTPIGREDIMELAVKLDDVIDGIEATMARFDYLNITFTNDYMKEFSEVVVASCEHMVSAFKLLARKKYMQIREHTIQINQLENEGDRLMREGVRDIFTHPKDPYQDFKLKEIYERLEETTDACEDVADILESVVLRYA